MRSIRRILLVGAAILLLAFGLIFLGGRVLACLGPLNVTQVQCIAAFNRTLNPDYSPGPPDGAWIPVALASVVMALAILPWRRPSIWAVAGLLESGAVGAIIGAIAYELTRETSLTGPTSSGEIITVLFAANEAARAMAAAIGAGLAIIAASVVLRLRAMPNTIG
jgi:hypothetical protein